MARRDADTTDHPQRSQTDHSLRLEREKADVSVTTMREAVEQEADDVLRVARKLADEVVEAARTDADQERHPGSNTTESAVERDRAQADAVVEEDRSRADLALKEQRAKRSRYLEDFLEAEREATDEDLVRERVQADTVLATRDEFLATVSHDLRSLLGSLLLNAGAQIKNAPEGADGDKIRKLAESSQRAVARMDRMISDLLDLASIKAGQLTMVLDEVDLGPILLEAFDAFEPVATIKRITMRAEAAPGPLYAGVDSGRILQVLTNLIGNAIKFTAPEGQVSIAIRAEGNEIQFDVSDTGIGIAADALPCVFDRFRQIHRDHRGLGLGLHISKGIVQAHGGRMWVESELAVGSTFHFALPSSPGVPPGEAATSSRAR